MSSKARIAVHKFSSCDGCQLAFLNLGQGLLDLANKVEIVHFAEAGPVAPNAPVDLAFVEGSVTTAEEIKRIQQIRKQSKRLISIGSCATSGGIQALRNGRDVQEWIRDIYAKPETIEALATSAAIADHVSVDFELWGCPVSQRQILQVINSMMFGVMPLDQAEKLCLECKRAQRVCVMVSQGLPCMGPVCRTGCGALCPDFGRACYACYGPAENPNTDSMAVCLEGLGLLRQDVARRFGFITSNADGFRQAYDKTREPPNG